MEGNSKQIPAEPGPEAEGESLRPMLLGVAARLLGRPVSDSDVQDCAAEALTRAVASRRPAGATPSAWAVGIVKHVVADLARRERRRQNQLSVLADAREVFEQTPDREVAAARDLNVLRQALLAMPARQREALVLFHIEGVAYRALAERLKVPMGTIATWLARGRAELLAAIERGGK